MELQAPCLPQRGEKCFDDAWRFTGKQFDFQSVPCRHGYSHGTFWTLPCEGDNGSWRVEKRFFGNRYVDENQVLDAVLNHCESMDRVLAQSDSEAEDDAKDISQAGEGGYEACCFMQVAEGEDGYNQHSGSCNAFALPRV